MQQYVPELKKIKIDDERVTATTVRGLPGEFQVGSGEDRASTTKYRQVIGRFRGKVDDALLILQFEDEILSDQEIDDFIKSIR